MGILCKQPLQQRQTQPSNLRILSMLPTPSLPKQQMKGIEFSMGQLTQCKVEAGLCEKWGKA